MEHEKFEKIVFDVISNMPDEFKELLDNVDIFIEDWPTREQLKSVGLRNKNSLLGLYEGIPRTNRGQNYNLVLPDRITIFKKPLEAHCSSVRELKEEIVRTVKHEIAHYFGIDDERLSQIENGN
ncbi:MAG: metallopeptidase family protein [Dehalococcoidia bacterium]|nr:metallopeptidase family protein [Dehalococcoidia bacterium]